MQTVRIEEIHEVLLADGWHEVSMKDDGQTSSFEVDNLLFADSRQPLANLGEVGFRFREGHNGQMQTSGPLSTILAIRTWSAELLQHRRPGERLVIDE